MESLLRLLNEGEKNMLIIVAQDVVLILTRLLYNKTHGKLQLGLCMGHGNTELIRKIEPKLSRTENTVDFLTLSEPNRTGKIFWYGSGSYMLSIPRTVPNCTELKNRN